MAARAQQKPMPVIGLLGSASPAPVAHLVAAFRDGLKEAGYVVGQNVAIEYRWAEGRYDRLPALAAELVARNVDVIATQRWSSRGARGEKRNLGNPNRLLGERSGRARTGCQPGPAGRQSDRGRYPECRADAEAARAAVRAGSPGESARADGKPDQRKRRPHRPRDAGSSARERAATAPPER